MTLPFTPDEFFDVFAAYNEQVWPFALMLWVLTAYVVVMRTRARPVRPWFIPALLAFHWAWSGLAYHAAFFSKVNPAAWMFAGLFVLEAGLLVWYGVVHHRFQLSRGPFFQQVLSWGLIVYALSYLVIVRAEGRVPEAADLRRAMSDDDLDHRVSVGGRSVVTTACGCYSADMGIHRWVGCILVRRARRTDAARVRSGTGSGFSPSKAHEEERSSGVAASLRWRRPARGGFPFSKPSPSASKPPHRGEKAKYKRVRDLHAWRLFPRLSLKLSLPVLKTPRNGNAQAPGTVIRTQRFFPPTTMPATGWRTPLYAHEPASTPGATRALTTRGARGIWRTIQSSAGTGSSNRRRTVAGDAQSPEERGTWHSATIL